MTGTATKRDLVVLLTACIQPGSVIHVARRDVETRLADYLWALEAWLGEPGDHRIVFCENSGHDLGPIRELCRRHHAEDRVELISFSGQDFPPERGKGVGEMRIISHALRQGRSIGPDVTVLKVTGRRYVGNFRVLAARLLREPRADVRCDLRHNLSVADSRVFSATPAFLAEYLVPQERILDDSQGVTFERGLARACHLALAEGKSWAMLPVAPDIRGTSGTTNRRTSASIARRWAHDAFRRAKSVVLAR